MSLFVEFVESSKCNIMSSANRDSFNSSFPICTPLISFSCLIALARVSSTILKRSGDSEHPCLVPVFKGSSHRFSPFNMMLAVGLLYIAFMMLRYVPSIPILCSVLIMNGCWILSNALLASIEMIM